jgi:hypothetical protein
LETKEKCTKEQQKVQKEIILKILQKPTRPAESRYISKKWLQSRNNIQFQRYIVFPLQKKN